MPDRVLSKEEAARLKRRRDVLLNTACNRHERPALLQEVRRINRRLEGTPPRFRPDRRG